MHMKKKYLILVVFTVFVAILSAITESIAPANIDDDFAGFIENPIKIESLANLRWLSETPEFWGSEENKIYYVQTSDIDASETKYWNDGEGFSPIGLFILEDIGDEYRHVSVLSFYGDYDGGGHAIQGLHILPKKEESIVKMIGLFSSINSAVISNLRLTDVNIVADFTSGPLVGQSVNSKILNSSAQGVIESRKNSIYLGGLVGSMISSSIERCFSTVQILGDSRIEDPEDIEAIYGTLGGLVGNMRDSVIENSYFLGSIQARAMYSGGIAGTVRNSKIVNSYVASLEQFNSESIALNVPTMEDKNQETVSQVIFELRAIAHTIRNSEILSVFFDKQTTGLSKAFYISDNVVTKNVRGLKTSQMKKVSTYKRRGWDFENVWDIDREINRGYPFLRSNLPYRHSSRMTL